MGLDLGRRGRKLTNEITGRNGCPGEAVARGSYIREIGKADRPDDGKSGN
jgi:hypothetical protein